MEIESAGSSIGLQILILFILILINAFFAASEIALISLNDNKLKKMADEGNKKAKKILKLLSNSSNFLATIQIGVTLAGFFTAGSAASNLSEPFANGLVKLMPSLSASAGLIKSMSFILVTLITSYFTLVLGELVPKRVAMQRSEKIAFAFIGVLDFIAVVFNPIVNFLSLSTNVVVSLLGMDPNADEEELTEEEIRMMVDVGGERGVIEIIQKNMIDNIFEFDDINAEDIMTPRMDIEAVPIEATIEEALEIAIEAGNSRLPVYEEDIDDVRGILHVKDLLPYVGKRVPEDINVRNIMRETVYVPLTKKCGELFAEMLESKIQMSIVSDEYGGVAGIVTIEDLIESIVGNIQDEYDEEEEDYIQICENEMDVDGSVNIDEFISKTGIELPEGDYETIGGFIMDFLGRIPKEDENVKIKYENIELEVKKMSERRIERVHIKVHPIEEDYTDEDEDDKFGNRFKKSRED